MTMSGLRPVLTLRNTFISESSPKATEELLCSPENSVECVSRSRSCPGSRWKVSSPCTARRRRRPRRRPAGRARSPAGRARRRRPRRDPRSGSVQVPTQRVLDALLLLVVVGQRDLVGLALVRRGPARTPRRRARCRRPAERAGLAEAADAGRAEHGQLAALAGEPAGGREVVGDGGQGIRRHARSISVGGAVTFGAPPVRGAGTSRSRRHPASGGRAARRSRGTGPRRAARWGRPPRSGAGRARPAAGSARGC